VIAAAALLAAACSSADPPAPRSTVSLAALGHEAGLTLVNRNGGAQKTRILESLGQGAAVLDYDRDGLLDVFIAAGGGAGEGTERDPRSALYRNLGGMQFVETTSEAGLAFEGWAHGAWRVDFDGDRWPDLYVTVSDGPNRFFRNAGGRFEEATDRWGGAATGSSTAAVFFDADGDLDLDLYVGNYVRAERRSPGATVELCEWHGLRVFCGPQGLPAEADSFWENRGGRLEEATRDSGFAAVAPSYTLGAVGTDLDDDGDLDLYVANDSQDNYAFENLGAGRFVEAGAAMRLDRNEEGRAQASMGVAVGDVDNDGRIDLYVTNFSHDSDTLFLNASLRSGRAVFEDGTFAAGLGLATFSALSWGVELVDLDRDGWLDLVVASGHVYPQVDTVPSGTTYAQQNQVFLSLGADDTGRVRFERYAPRPEDAFSRVGVSRGLAAADLDDDGDADFLVVALDAAPTLVRNDSRPAGHWLGLTLAGAAPNTEAVGARVWIEDSAGRVQLRERHAGGSYLSSSDPRLLVGLGAASGPARVTLRWPSGRTTVHEGLEPGRYHDLGE
jgi:hypothetical protein